jgi:acetyltransferase-like isoleucine patch superfamily enzyme
MKILFQSFFSVRSWKMRTKKISLFSFFDRKTIIHHNCKINRFVFLRESIIGAYSYIGPNSSLFNTEMGKFCSVSKNINIGAPIHPINFVSTNPIFFRESNGTGSSWVKGIYFDDSSPKTNIGNDVWIGMNVSIMGGIKIGDGAIIGAHALVTKEVPPYAIVGGVPARIIKYRFEPDVINRLLEIKWWNLSDEEILEKIEFFREPEITVDVINKYFK